MLLKRSVFTNKNVVALVLGLTAIGFAPLMPTGAAQLPVVFNEIAWMGTTNSSYDEWLELKNNQDISIDLTGWTIVMGDGQTTINLSSSIPPLGYFLLERTDDTSVPQIPANQIYTGALDDNGESLRLLDGQNNLVDEINAQDRWPAGDKSQKLTMERTADNQWQNSANAGGTPKAANSSPTASPSPSVTSSASPTPSPSSSAPNNNPSPLEPFQYSQNILVNEFMPFPEKDSTEWVELYNSGSEKINLNGWQITNSAGPTHAQAIPEGTAINPGDFLVVAFPQSIFNNEGDQAQLLWPDDQAIHIVDYQQAAQGLACAKFSNGWLWTNQPTPGQGNKKSSTQKALPLTESLSGPAINPVQESAPAAPAPINVAVSSVSLATVANPTKTPLEPNNSPPAASAWPPAMAAASQLPFKNADLKTLIILSAVLILALLTALVLIFFRRKTKKEI